MNPEDVHNFLSRWSRRKLEKAEPGLTPQAAPEIAAPSPVTVEGEAVAPPPEPLPLVESLTPDSDFKPFMRPDVEPGLKQAALKQLFKHPHFNVMDGLDTYIEDYSIPDPIPDEMMKNLYQAREHLFSPEEKAAADAADAAAEETKEAERALQAEEVAQAFAQPVEPALPALPADPAKDA